MSVKKKGFIITILIIGICAILGLSVAFLQFDSEITADDVALVQVCGETIYLSDVDRTYNSLYGYMDSVDEESIRVYKREILENGINELVIVHEGLNMGMDLDIEGAKELVEQLKLENPDMYSLANDQIGIERYTLDLAKSQLIKDVCKKVLEDFSVSDIEDDELYNWYSEQLETMGQHQDVEYGVFLKNREYVYQKWKEQCENTYFSEWVKQRRAGSEVVYLISDSSWT